MGAGDEFIITGQVREMQNSDPRKVKVMYERPRWHRLWDRNPRIAGPDERGDFQILQGRVNGLRPYCTAKSDVRWTWKAWGPPVGEMYFSAGEQAFGDVNRGHIVIEPHVKSGASPNKRWPLERWKSFVSLLNRAGIKPVQLGSEGTKVISGAEFIRTDDIRKAAAVLARSRAAVLTEGALHHIAAGVGLPAVVLYGGYISPAVTGYPTQRNLFTGEGLGCGWRTPCACCEAAMAKITPEMVMAELKAVL